ncbi:MAG TPA: hypothetical protein VFH77_07980 [Streptomyces sp.]|nr:hypothetical protein [Streptomyces sp.]
MSDDAHRPRPLLLLAALVAALLLAGGGYYAGRTTTPDTPTATPTADSCEDPRSAVTDLLGPDPATVDHDSAKQALTVVLQNPDCFDAKTRAQAQTTLDNMRQQQEQDLQDQRDLWNWYSNYRNS